jgi:cysteine-rich repeat protein
MRLQVFSLILGLITLLPLPLVVVAETVGSATTTLTLSVCGNSVVDDPEQCDVPGETGLYSTTIAGRQCSTICKFGPYCGDGILQSSQSEECDDGNNDDADFCSAICKVEPAGSGGGGSSGGGSGGGGGSDDDLGDTIVTVTGISYPGRTINILLDTENVGSVRAGNDGRFEFSTDASPGTASLGFWATDSSGTRSITFNSTFDVTQGAVTNINGIILPPTLKLSSQNINPGDVVLVSGQSVPNAKIELKINNDKTETTTAASDGTWSISVNTSGLRAAEYTLKARSITGTTLQTQSSFSTAMQLFVGVNGAATRPSDLNRDGKINLIDFSILIFWWGTNGGNSNPPADINANQKVGIEDFSILLFNWTG